MTFRFSSLTGQTYGFSCRATRRNESDRSGWAFPYGLQEAIK